MSSFSSLIWLPDYDMMLFVSKGPAHLTASRYKAKNGYAGLFQFLDNAGREEVFSGFVFGWTTRYLISTTLFHAVRVFFVLIRDWDV